MAQLKYAIIAYDDEKQSDDVYFETMQALFADDDEIQFINHWGTVNDLINFINNDGNSAVNQIDRLIILDKGFQDQDSATQMTEDFTTLEQTFNNAGIDHPFLVWLTGNQGVYDLCSKDAHKEEPLILCYDRVRIIRLITDSNGNIDNDSLINGIDGTNDNSALSIRKDFMSRGERAIKNLKDRQKATQNRASQTSNLNDISSKLKKRYHLSEEEPKKKNNSGNELENVLENMHKAEKKLDKELGKSRKSFEVPDVEKESPRKSIVHSADDNLIAQINDLTKELSERTEYNLRVKYQTNHHTFTIVVAGKHGSGVSSVVANLAECFAYLNQKVLIINSSENDGVTRYFPNFANLYKENKRHKVLADRSNKSGNQTRYIPVTSMIDLMSDLGATQSNYSIDERIGGLSTFLLNDKSEHQIILIDAGENAYQAIHLIGKINLSSLVFVTNNDFQSIRDLMLIGHSKQRLSGTLKSVFQDQPLGLIVNQCTNKDFISTKERMTESELRKEIMKLSPPLDRLSLLGKIPYYSEWHLQSLINTRACYFDDEIFEIMLKIAERTVVS